MITTPSELVLNAIRKRALTLAKQTGRIDCDVIDNANVNDVIVIGPTPRLIEHVLEFHGMTGMVQ